MSNSLAIAAVTATLSSLLDHRINASAADDPSTDPGLAGTGISTKSLDKARTGSTNQLNLFLYQTAVNAAWRNMDMPRRTRPNEQGQPPLALSLHYLITAYGNGDDEVLGQRVLGRAMSVLHDHALLGPQEIKAALSGSDLGDQIERVRITPMALSVEEISKLWTVFQTAYRLSAAYEVSVVLIDSNTPAKAALPVLRRGQDNRGVLGQASLDSPYPALASLTLPNAQPALKPGQAVAFNGTKLSGSSQGILLQHTAWEAGVEVGPEAGGSDLLVSAKVPDTPASWPAGFYTGAVLVQRPGESCRRSTNALSFPVAPRIASALPMMAAVNSVLAVGVAPEVLPGQRASLLLGSQELFALAHPAQTGTLHFQLPAGLSGNFPLRLRVDGVDSQLVVDFTADPPVFDPNQSVTIS